MVRYWSIGSAVRCPESDSHAIDLDSVKVIDSKDPARIFYECVEKLQSQLIPICERLLEDPSFDWDDQENTFYLVIKYYLLIDDAHRRKAHQLADRFYLKFGLMRPRIVNALIGDILEHGDRDLLSSLITKIYFHQIELDESSYLKLLTAVNKYQEGELLFWPVMSRLLEAVQFTQYGESLGDAFSAFGYRVREIVLTHGLCECGLRAGYADVPVVNLHKFAQHITLPPSPQGKTIVVDGANVGFYDLASRKGGVKPVKNITGSGINWNNLVKMDRILSEAGHRALFVFNERHRQENSKFNSGTQGISMFFSPRKVNDDLYFAYLAMTLRIPLVSNDDLSDMCLSIDPNIDAWIRRNRICYRFEAGDRIGFFYKNAHRKLFEIEPISYSITLQCHGSGFLMPYLREERVKWICLQKTEGSRI
jgi:hypothetical protein